LPVPCTHRVRAAALTTRRRRRDATCLAAFDDPALERVFGVVEPVLPRGEPQTPKTYDDEQLPRLVWRAPQDDD